MSEIKSDNMSFVSVESFHDLVVFLPEETQVHKSIYYPEDVLHLSSLLQDLQGFYQFAHIAIVQVHLNIGCD
jgi:hypothetical protein